jgi:hypothetical protein
VAIKSGIEVGKPLDLTHFAGHARNLVNRPVFFLGIPAYTIYADLFYEVAGNYNYTILVKLTIDSGNTPESAVNRC